MPSIQRSRKTGMLLNLIALATSVASFARAQTPTVETALAESTHDAVQLDKYVISATRTPQDPRNTPSAVTSVRLDELSVSQVPDLRTALAEQPGVVVVNTGAKGGQSAIYMRGAANDQVLLFVDGVRMNTTEAGYANFLGGANLVGIDRLEVLRGPQSTLYGSSAMGGVITIDTTHGCGAPSGTVTAEFGSFDTLGGSLAVQGGSQLFGFSASVSRERTDNKRPDNDFRETSYSTRLEFTPVKSFLIGTTVRGQVGTYDEPGTATSDKGEVRAPNHLLTTYVQWSPDTSFRSRVTGAWHQTEYTWVDNTWGPSSNFYSRTTRRIIDWQNTWLPAKWIELVAGANAEWAHYMSGGSELSDDQTGIYASASLHPITGLTIDGGGRSDDHKVDGRDNTWRTGASYYLSTTGTKFRSTYGTGFKVPSMINRFGSPPWYGPSPAIKPEKSKGWDAGFDQEVFGDRLIVSATYFHNDFRDLIVSSYMYPPGKYIAQNVRKAYTEGGEFSVDAKPVEFLKLHAAYTYLTAIDNSNSANPVRLVRRPRHTGDFEVQILPTSQWVLGVGLHVVGAREESVYDPNTWSSKQVDAENYTVARAFVSYTTSDRMTLKLRVENALNEKYSEVYGYDALPRGVFGGVEWKF